MSLTRFPAIVLCTLVMVAGQAAMPGLVPAAPAVDGDGNLVVAPTSVVYGSSGNTLTFTFTANNDFVAGSQVAIDVPAGWTPPTTGGSAGHVSVASGTCTLKSSPLGIGGMTIFIDMVSCITGNSFTVTYSGVTPAKAVGSPYTFATQTDIGPGGGGLVGITAGSPTVAVDPVALTVSAAGLTPAGKTYDGTTAATLTVGSPTLVGVVGTDVVSLVSAGATADFADRNVGLAKLVVIAGLTLGGADAGNYSVTQPTRSARIDPLPITVTAATDVRVYDGTTRSAGAPAISAGTLAPGDSAPVWAQSFGNRNAGTGKSLTPSGAVLDGNGGLNYAYTFVPDATGVITPLPITVTAVPDTKVYDGTTGSAEAPVLSPATPLAPADSAPMWTQNFDTPNAGTGKTLTPAGAVVDGNGGLNYAYTFSPDTTGVISQRPVTVVADPEVKALGTPDPPLTYQVTSGSLVVGDLLTLTRAAGEALGAYPISIGSFPAAVDYDLTFVGADLTISPTLLFFSGGALDGWVLESSRSSSVGGSFDAKATTFRLGDDAADRQYRAILSFDTSFLPDTAVIQSASLQIKRIGAPAGANPFTVMGKMLVDVRKGTFGARALAPTDFQAQPTKAGVGVVGAKPVGAWYGAYLTPAGMSKINKTGITQFRLLFAKGDNNNQRADYLKFVSGDAAVGPPQLTITYSLP